MALLTQLHPRTTYTSPAQPSIPSFPSIFLFCLLLLPQRTLPLPLSGLFSYSSCLFFFLSSPLNFPFLILLQPLALLQSRLSLPPLALIHPLLVIIFILCVPSLAPTTGTNTLISLQPLLIQTTDSYFKNAFNDR